MMRFRDVKMCNLNPKGIAKFDELIYTMYILKSPKMLCSVEAQSVPPYGGSLVSRKNKRNEYLVPFSFAPLGFATFYRNN